MKFMQPLNILISALSNGLQSRIYFSKEYRSDVSGWRLLNRLAVILLRKRLGHSRRSRDCGCLCSGHLLIVLILPAVNYHPAAALVPIMVVGFLGATGYHVLGAALKRSYSKHVGWMPVILYKRRG